MLRHLRSKHPHLLDGNTSAGAETSGVCRQGTYDMFPMFESSGYLMKSSFKT